MRYVAAYLLAQLGGTASPSKADLDKILGSVGVDCEADRANQIIKALKGKSVEEVIASGADKLAAVSSGCGAAAAPVAAAAAAPAEDKKEDKKKKEESEDEDGDDMGFGLFD